MFKQKIRENQLIQSPIKTQASCHVFKQKEAGPHCLQVKHSAMFLKKPSCLIFVSSPTPSISALPSEAAQKLQVSRHPPGSFTFRKSNRDGFGSLAILIFIVIISTTTISVTVRAFSDSESGFCKLFVTGSPSRKQACTVSDGIISYATVRGKVNSTSLKLLRSKFFHSLSLMLLSVTWCTYFHFVV